MSSAPPDSRHTRPRRRTTVGTSAGSGPESKGERTQRRVLAAAIEHFAAVGLDAGSMPAIARAVGVSHSTLYQHFGRKDDLFRTAVDTDMTALFATLSPALAEPDQSPERIVGLIAVLARRSREHPLARRVLAELDGEQTEALRDLPALAELETQLAEAIAAGQRAGTVRADIAPADAAAGLIAVALSMLVVTIRLDGMTDIPRADQAARYLVATLRPPTAPTSRTTSTRRRP